MEGPEGGSKRGRFFFPAGRLPLTCGAVTFTHGQSMARSNLNHAEWRGGVGGLRGPGETSSIARTLCWSSRLCSVTAAPFLPLRRRRRSRRGLRCWVSQQGLLGGMRVGHRFLERSAGRGAGGQGGGWEGPWLLGVRSVPSEPHAHGRDKGGPFAAAVFGQEEGHGALR